MFARPVPRQEAHLAGIRLVERAVVQHQYAPPPLHSAAAAAHSVAGSGSSRCKSRVKASCASGSGRSGCARAALWIGQRLSGGQADLAQHIWESSEHTLNPRDILRPQSLVDEHRLADLDPRGVYRSNNRGTAFLNHDPILIQELDDSEGLL